jgi:hypothetical protein
MQQVEGIPNVKAIASRAAAAAGLEGTAAVARVANLIEGVMAKLTPCLNYYESRSWFALSMCVSLIREFSCQSLFVPPDSDMGLGF